MTFDEFLKEHSWSVARISVALEVNPATVTKWKYNSVIPRKDDILKIHAFTDGKVTPNDFYGIN